MQKSYFVSARKKPPMSIDEVITYIEDAIRENIASAQPISIQGVENSTSKKSSKKSNVKCPRCCTPMFLRNGKNGSFWDCSNYPECRITDDDKNGKPIFRKWASSSAKNFNIAMLCSFFLSGQFLPLSSVRSASFLILPIPLKRRLRASSY